MRLPFDCIDFASKLDKRGEPGGNIESIVSPMRNYLCPSETGSLYRLGLSLDCLQTVVARETDPLHSQVVSLTRFNTGGNAYNVIPDVVKLGATYRSLTHQGMVNMKSRLGEVCL